MRLTLRTLLAWLDAVLPPDEQQALGDKVAASPVAPPLIARLRDVVQRPLLAAPRLDGRGMADDANSVAEYLDNTLPTEKLEPFERICIESDVHLAEVAACHSLLAALAREPAKAGPLAPVDQRRLRARIEERWQGLGREAADSGVVTPAGHGGREGRPAPGIAVPPTTAARPLPRRRAPLAAWLLAAVAALLLVVLVGMLVLTLGRQRGRQVVAHNPPAAARSDEDVAAPAPREVPGAGGGETATEVSRPAAVAAEPAAGAASDAVAPPAAATPDGPPAEEPAPLAPPVPPPPVMPALPDQVAPATPQPRVPQGDALAIAAPVPPPAAPPATPPADAPPASAADAVGVFGDAGLLLRLAVAAPAVHGQSGWAAAQPDAPLGPREDLIAPPLCRPEVRVAGVTIRLEPNTRAVITRDADGTPRLEIVFGRAVLLSSVARPRLGITAGGLIGAITDGMRDPVGVEVTLERPVGADPATTPARVRAFIATTKSGIAWSQAEADGAAVGLPAAGLLEKGGRLAWDSIAPGAVDVDTRREPPEWLVGPPRIERLDEEAAQALAAKAASDPLERGLRELADDRRAENRVAAVATLALLGDYDELVAALAAESPPRKLEDRQWTRLFDTTVPLALSRGANAAARLGRAFESRAPEGSGAEAFTLARGFDDAALADGGAARLVAALDAPELLLRRLAIRELVETVEPAEVDRSRYRPDRSKELRRESVSWWRRKLEEGLVRRPAAAATNR